MKLLLRVVIHEWIQEKCLEVKGNGKERAKLKCCCKSEKR